jgi:DNA (cytosine-5)-methyltransferase 1
MSSYPKEAPLSSKSYRPKKPGQRIRVLSLFAGCGGFDLGFIGGFSYRNLNLSKNGFEIVFANDFDSDAERVYEANRKYFGEHVFHGGDVRSIRSHEIPEFDVLLAGFPCQPFSNAGNRKGTEDKDGRGTLFYECERFLKVAKKKTGKLPPIFVFENVRGIMSSKMPNGTLVTEEIEKRMSRLGYNVRSKLLKASDYGVPQNRYRFIMVGTRKDLPIYDFDILDIISRKAKLPREQENPYELTLGSILSDIPKDSPQFNDYWKYSPGGQKMVDQIGPCVDGKEALRKFRNKVPLEKISSTIKQGRSWKNIPVSKLTPRFRKIHDDPVRYHAPNFYRRFALGEICGTITASAQPENCGITHPFENRRMSLREVARVQSFPDDFTFPHTSIAGAYKVIGNAVPPILAWCIGRSVKEYFVSARANVA